MTLHTNAGVRHPGTTLTAPGKTLAFIRTTDAELAFEETVERDAPPVPVHVHTRQSERFTVLEGTMSVTLDGVTREMTAGQSVTVPPCARHTYANAGEGLLRIEVALFPALGAKQFFECIYGMQRTGRLPPSGLRDALSLAALAHEHGFYLGPLPVAIMRPLMALGAGVAQVIGVRPWLPEYAAKASQAGDGALRIPLHL
jgi:mannose-6-phosphate isomerase-like protein (cupin superfamily)